MEMELISKEELDSIKSQMAKIYESLKSANNRLIGLELAIKKEIPKGAGEFIDRLKLAEIDINICRNRITILEAIPAIKEALPKGVI
jgi:phage terminase large subunit-like protein